LAILNAGSHRWKQIKADTVQTDTSTLGVSNGTSLPGSFKFKGRSLYGSTSYGNKLYMFGGTSQKEEENEDEDDDYDYDEVGPAKPDLSDEVCRSYFRNFCSCHYVIGELTSLVDRLSVA
jgi:hypothetical protein